MHGAQHTEDPLPVLAPAGPPWARGRQAPACSMEEDGDRESGVLLGLMHAWPPTHMIPSRLGAPRSRSQERFPSGAWAPPHPRRSVRVCAVERAMRRGLALPLGRWSAHRGVQWGLPTVRGRGGGGRTPKQGMRNCS